MAKSIKFNNDIYLDSAGATHDQESLSDILNYSTEEQKIGKYNGSSLYKKNYILSIDETRVIKEIDTGLSNATIINMEGFYIGNSYSIPLNFINSNGNGNYCHLNSDGSKFYCRTYFEKCTAYITLYYIK